MIVTIITLNIFHFTIATSTRTLPYKELTINDNNNKTNTAYQEIFTSLNFRKNGNFNNFTK